MRTMRKLAPHGLRRATAMSGVIFALFVAALVFSFMSTSSAHANSEITSCTDLYLNQALAAGGAITFNCNGNHSPATIVVSGPRDIAKNTVIDGGGVITIAGNGTRIFTVGEGVTATLMNLVIRDGSMSTGGGIFNYGTLNVSNTLFISNSADMRGSAITNYLGVLRVTDSRFVENAGSAILHISATTFIARSVFSNNVAGAGAALYVDNGGVMSVSNSLFISNVATANYGGGAVYAADQTSIILAQSTFVSNTGTSGGVLFNYGRATLRDSTLSGNATASDHGAGGAIYNQGVLTVTGSLFTRNTTQQFGDGGAIMNYLTATIANSTFAQNSAGAWGGVLQNTMGAATVLNSTLVSGTAAQGGNIYVLSGIVVLKNVIVANGSPNNCNALGNPSSLGHNLDSDLSCGFSQPSDVHADPQLGPLQDNGGATWTLAPLSGSPVIDTGDDASCPATDQRGAVRPYDGDGNGSAVCDIGAVEFGAKISQTISFPLIGNKFLNQSPVLLSASASSGLTVTYSVLGACSLSAQQLVLNALGLCTVTAHQPGNVNYYAAPDSEQGFTIRGQTFMPLLTR